MEHLSTYRIQTAGGEQAGNFAEPLVRIISGTNTFNERFDLPRVTTSNLVTLSAISDPAVSRSFLRMGILVSDLERSPFNIFTEPNGRNKTMSGPSMLAIQRAITQANDDGSEAIHTHHLFQGLVDTTEGYAASMIRELEVNPEELIAEIMYQQALLAASPIEQMRAALTDEHVPHLKSAAIRDLLKVIG